MGHLPGSPKDAHWAKFLLEQHHERKSHRVASGTERKQPKTAAMPPQPQPLACLIDRPIALSAEDDALVKGNVPSLAEWQDGWAVLSETVPLRKVGRIDDKRRASNPNRKRKRLRRQLLVMAEVLRRKVRKVLQQATSISLSLDACKYRKIIRFRADLPSLGQAATGAKLAPRDSVNQAC